jgi:hypothetical protein
MAVSIRLRVTLLTIDDWLAMTRRHELGVRQVLDPRTVGYAGRKRRVATVRPPSRPWTPAELARLGTAAAAELAAAFGPSESSVRTKRWKQSRAAQAGAGR